MNKSKKILFVFVVLLILILTIRYIDRSHWSVKSIDDNTIIPVTNTVSSIQDGLFFAEKEAKKWNENAALVGVSVVYEGDKVIKSRKGKVIYRYYVKNTSFFGYPDVICRVTVDFNKQAITRFETWGGYKLADEPMDILKCNLDIENIFHVVEGIEEFKIIEKYDNPKIILHVGEKFSFIDLFSAADAYNAEERIEFVINNTTKTIASIKRLPKISMPR